MGCTAPKQSEPVKESIPLKEDMSPENPLDEVQEPIEPEETETPPAPLNKEPVQNEIPEGEAFYDLQEYEGSAEEILFHFLDDRNKEYLAKNSQALYMKMDKQYQGKVRIYYPKWVETSDDFFIKESEMIGQVWKQADEGESQYLEATLHNYMGKIAATVKIIDGEVQVEVE